MEVGKKGFIKANSKKHQLAEKAALVNGTQKVLWQLLHVGIKKYSPINIQALAVMKGLDCTGGV